MIPDNLASVGWHAGQGGQTLGSADVLVAWEEGALLPGAHQQDPDELGIGVGAGPQAQSGQTV